MRSRVFFAYVTTLLCALSHTSRAQDTKTFTHADTLRGTITPERAWWNVTFYDLRVRITPSDSSIRGANSITYKVVARAREMQIDLITPLQVDSMIQDKTTLTYRQDGNAFFVKLVARQRVGDHKTITVYYHGKPRIANNPPWDGGFIWTRDSTGNVWVSVACQGFGASVWWPNKDTQADEPDSQRVAVTVPDPMLEISNGRLRATTHNNDGTTTYDWFVNSPINNYDVSIYAGTYAHFSDSYAGERGKLTMDFWPLATNLEKAKSQFAQAKTMLHCFEHWFGPYPWYADGYKLVEAPFLGMEHQSAIAYGNHYVNGYLGTDLSGTGHGSTWDYILVHESGHEWFGNNITSKDIADMWIQESFTTYSEGLYTECQSGKEAGAAYLRGLRDRVGNDQPIIGQYGVNNEGSADMYFKGSNMLHTMRQIVGDDKRWRKLLRGLNATFWHKTVTGREIEQYINRQTGINFDKVFQQYLTTVQIPILEYKMDSTTLSYRWTHVVPGFDMPVKVTLKTGQYSVIRPTEAWQTTTVHLTSPTDFHVDKDFFVIPNPL